MTTPKCRWGVMGAAMIAHKNWKAICLAPNAEITAVASRERERAQQFIDECQREAPFEQTPRAVEGYDELLASDQVDAVYIPLPTGIRKEWAIKAAEAGKHVMGEKPSGVDAAEVREILDACERNHVQYMDGVMFMHSARMNRIRETLDDGRSVGNVRRIATQFSFLAPDEFLRDNIRVSSELEPAGVLGDLGWYNIRFALWVMNWRLPTRVSGRQLAEIGGAESPARVPVEFSGELFFEDDVTASFYCSFLNDHQQWAHVSGDKGSLSVSDFVLPRFGNEVDFVVNKSEFRLQGCDFNMQDYSRRVAVPEYSNSDPSAQESRLFENFSQLVLSGETDARWGEYSLKTQQILDACLRSAREDGRIVEL